MNFFLNRVKKYNPSGRLQTEEESNQIAKELHELLDKFNLKYTEETGDLNGGNRIFNKIMNYLNTNSEANKNEKI